MSFGEKHFGASAAKVVIVNNSASIPEHNATNGGPVSPRPLLGPKTALRFKPWERESQHS